MKPGGNSRDRSGIHPNSSGLGPPYLLFGGLIESSIKIWGIPMGLQTPLASSLGTTTNYLRGSTSGSLYSSFSGSFLL